MRPCRARGSAPALAPTASSSRRALASSPRGRAIGNSAILARSTAEARQGCPWRKRHSYQADKTPRWLAGQAPHHESGTEALTVVIILLEANRPSTVIGDLKSCQRGPRAQRGRADSKAAQAASRARLALLALTLLARGS